MGIMRMGFVVSFLADSVVSGFTTGAAVLIMSSQVIVGLLFLKCSLNVP
jgi:MFS superfamily sulfate permease-like transporter